MRFYPIHPPSPGGFFHGDFIMLLNLGLGMRPRCARSATLFIPSSLSGLIGWYDAADAATITESGGLVSGLADKSGAGNNLVGSGNNKPHTGNATLNGLNVINFTDGSFAKLLSLSGTASGALLTGLSAMASSISFVFKQDAAASSGAPICLKSTTNADSLIPDLSTGGIGYFPDDSSTSFLQVNPTQTPRGTAYCLTLIWSGSGITLYKNGTQIATDTAAGSNYLNRFVLGYRVATSQKWSGSIAELCVINRALTSEERGELENYLMDKWGL